MFWREKTNKGLSPRLFEINVLYHYKYVIFLFEKLPNIS